LVSGLFLSGRSPEIQQFALQAIQSLTGGAQPQFYIDLLPALLECFSSSYLPLVYSTERYFLALISQDSVLAQVRHLNWVSQTTPLLLSLDGKVLQMALTIFLIASKDDTSRFLLQKARLEHLLKGLFVRLSDLAIKTLCLKLLSEIQKVVPLNSSEDVQLFQSSQTNLDDPFSGLSVADWK